MNYPKNMPSQYTCTSRPKVKLI